MPAVTPYEKASRLTERSGPAGEARLLQVIYCSRVRMPMAAEDLHGMVFAAQQRNAAESVSGVMVFDRSLFYQWLEGPVAAVERVMRSIKADLRHTEIHVLGNQIVSDRVFPGWDMRLAGSMADGVSGRVMRLAPETADALRRAPDGVVEVLRGLAPRRRPPIPRLETESSRILRDVILTRVIPELSERRRRMARAGSHLAPHPDTPTLARFLAAGDTSGAAAVMRGAMRAPGELVTLLARLAEPAARLLGDYWADDEVGELDVTLGLCCLRAAVRQVAVLAPAPAPATRAPLVLSAADPGEPHALGPVLHPEAMWQAGWSPKVAPGKSREALLDMLAGERFDCLDLSMSATFARREHLPGVADSIAQFRRASRNPALAVVVSGRAAAGDGARRLGADAAVASALDVVASVRRAVALRVG